MSCDSLGIALNIVSLVLNLAVFCVLVKTYRAADRQADAATELTVATSQQIALQKEQAEAARMQQRVTRRQIEESLRPIVLFSSGAGSDTNMQTHVVNHGAGPALDVRWSYGTLQKATEWKTFASGIMAKDEPVDWSYSARDGMLKGGIVFHYRSLAGGSYSTQFSWVDGQMKASYIDNGD